MELQAADPGWSTGRILRGEPGRAGRIGPIGSIARMGEVGGVGDVSDTGDAGPFGGGAMVGVLDDPRHGSADTTEPDDLATGALHGEDFARATFQHRRELLTHCYRMLGSVHDAEDLVQETMLRAWRAHADYDPTRASLRTWLYRIATNVCLTALDQRRRRPLPSGLVGPSAFDAALDRRPEVLWLQPLPDTLLTGAAADPAAVVAARGSVRLALVAALQYLPARQRAVLILRDVLAWRAAEVADLLGTSTAAVNSALQRARTQLAELAPDQDQVADQPGNPDHRDLLERYVTAFQAADADALARLVREDIVCEMPPVTNWFCGRDPFIEFFRHSVFTTPEWRLVRANANGQPGFVSYKRHPDGCYRAHSAQVLTLTPTGISALIAFNDPTLFPLYGVAMTRPAESFAANAFTGL
ncbi:MAG TPA: RNA polymerase subunit sigma-70 [Actinocrinis sp.]|nr:RNA polymerase subunit sigma-70 [Actinocrinis sp.]